MPLAGKLVAITRGAVGGMEWRQKLTNLGAQVYNLPTITTTPVEPNAGIAKTLAALDTYDWLVFTSASGVRCLVDLNAQLGIDLNSTHLPNIVAIGSRTASAANSAGLKVAFVPSMADSIHLAAELEPVTGKRVLLLRTTIASDDLPAALTARGADVTDLPIYRTEPITQPDSEFSRLLADGAVDYITFASPSAVAGIESRLREADLVLARQVPAISIGTSVTEALHRTGFQHIHTAKAASLQGIVDVLRGLSN